MIFGILLLGTVAALVASVVYHNRARKEQQVTKAALAEAQQQKLKADMAALSAQTSFQTAVASTDKLGLDLMDYVRGDMMVPTATVLKIVAITTRCSACTTSGAQPRFHRRLLPSPASSPRLPPPSPWLLQQHPAATRTRPAHNTSKTQAKCSAHPAAPQILLRSASAILTPHQLGNHRAHWSRFRLTPPPSFSSSQSTLTEAPLHIITLASQQPPLIRRTQRQRKARWRVRALEGMGLSQTEDTEGERWMQEADKALASNPQLPAAILCADAGSPNSTIGAASSPIASIAWTRRKISSSSRVVPVKSSISAMPTTWTGV